MAISGGSYFWRKPYVSYSRRRRLGIGVSALSAPYRYLTAKTVSGASGTRGTFEIITPVTPPNAYIRPDVNTLLRM